MKVCFFGTYEENYSRNQLIQKALGALGHSVEECHVSLWKGEVDKSNVLKGWRGKVAFLYRLVSLYPSLFIRYLKAPRHDVMVVGYFGHLDVIVARLFSLVLRRRERIIFDAFLSLYDSMILDRKMASKGSMLARLVKWLDRKACESADVVLLDTEHHIEFFEQEFVVNRSKMVRVFASADTEVFYPRESVGDKGRFRVLFYGKYIPLHGIEHIVDAASILRDDEGIAFTFIGKGQLYREVRARVDSLALTNIDFIEWVDYEALPEYIAEADICLGIFAASAKSGRVIPNKVFQAMAMGKPIITARTPGASEGLVDRENVLFCEPGDSEDLARAIRMLRSDHELAVKIAAGAKQTFDREFGPIAVRAAVSRALEIATS